MGLYDFIALDMHKKVDTVWDHATYLTWRSYEKGRVNLYALEDFYVEVYYDEEFNCVEDIRCFRSLDCLDVYLDNMDLQSLFAC